MAAVVAITKREVHPTAVVAASARLEDDVVVGPYAIVGDDVTIGKGSRLHAHAVVLGPTVLGAGNTVHSFAVIGGDAQHKAAPSHALVTGDDCTFREHATVHRGTSGGTTRIGSGTLVMCGAHVGHDAAVGAQVVLANAVQIAGHAVIGDYVVFGGLAGVAQFVRVGESAFVAAGAMVERDVPPFVVVQGDRAKVRGVNAVGLRRRGVSPSSIALLQKCCFKLFNKSTSTKQASLAELRADSTLATDEWVARFLQEIS